MSNKHVAKQHTARPLVARTIHRFSVLIILAWLAIAVIVTIGVPPLEQVEREHAVSLTPQDAPSVQAMTRMGEAFKESNSESVAVIVLEGEQPLGDDAHRYYDRLIRQLKDDPTHVQHIQDFWGDPLTAGAAQSADGKAAYVQLNLAGQLGPGFGERIGRSRPGRRGPYAAAAGGQGVCHRPGGDRRGYGQEWQQDGHPDHGGEHRRDLRHVAPRLPFGHHRNPFVADGRDPIAGGPRNRRVPRRSRDCRSYYLRRQSVGIRRDRGWNGLRDLLLRAVSRGTSSRRGSGNGFLHHLPRGRQGRLGVRSDDRRSDLLPQLYPAALLPTPGRPRRGGHIGRGRGGPHADSGSYGRRQPFRLVRAQADDQDSSDGGG